MHRNNLLLYLPLVSWMFTSCIQEYDPEILASDEKKYVISGYVTNEDDAQSVNISISSPINEPKYIPVINCEVNIVDNRGRIFPMQDNGDGNYTNEIDLALLQPGTAYKLEVTTPEGDFITSDFDTLPPGPGIDSVYFIRGAKSYNPSAPPIIGIQFYLDFHGDPSDSRYYKWDVYETWEYHTRYPIEWFYNGKVNHVSPPDSSRMICWRTIKIPEIFTLATDNFSENRYDQYALHFVNNLYDKLAIGYSIQVRQFALSPVAFIYFKSLNVNSNPQGGLYDKQPLAIKGNFHNITHPDLDVLGFFAASTTRSKRIFVYHIPDLPLRYPDLCDPTPIIGGLSKIKPINYPVYLLGDSNGFSYTWLDIECVDCLSLGGDNHKPDFWPN